MVSRVVGMLSAVMALGKECALSELWHQLSMIREGVACLDQIRSGGSHEDSQDVGWPIY